MGLTTWKQSPNGKILKNDVTVAKNYLTEEELSSLRRAVTAFLDIAESRARRRIPTNMTQWISIMNGYLDLNEYPKLAGTGSISKATADSKAIQEYTAFRIHQDREFVGDFEREVERIEKRLESPEDP